MGFYRIFPSKDAWITNAHPNRSVTVRATGSNHGASPALNIFARKADISSGSIELARTLVQFDLTELSGKIYDEKIIPSSSIQYILKMFNMGHDDTLPTSYDINIYPLSRSWDEGGGIDDDEFEDDGYANWSEATSVQTWTTTGSDYLISEFGSATKHFDTGGEDIEVDVTDIVINWLTGSLQNNGLLLKMGDTEESNSVNYFKKLFHGRETKYVDRLPYIEARWSNVVKDNRNNFSYDQVSRLYMYNVVRGEPENLTEPILIRIQDNEIGVSASFIKEITASFVEVGLYSASFLVENTASYGSVWYDIWHSGSRIYMSGTFRPIILTGSQADPYSEYVIDVTNLKSRYGVNEEARLKVNVRKKDWITHIGILSSASFSMDTENIEKLYYSIENDDTGEVIVPFGTGSVAFTQTSYNQEGNYFNIYMSAFVPGLKYRIKFLIDINRYDKKIIDNEYIFRVF